MFRQIENSFEICTLSNEFPEYFLRDIIEILPKKYSQNNSILNIFKLKLYIVVQYTLKGIIIINNKSELAMKKLFFVFAFLFVATFANAQGVIKFKTESHDFGKVEEGVQATHTFEFTNTGTAPVVISNAQASCGCTTPDWTKEPVMPGKTGKVTASFNSQGRPGSFSKTVTVISNSETPQIVLSIKGEVNPKGAEKAAEPAPAPAASVTKAVPAAAAPAPAPAKATTRKKSSK